VILVAIAALALSVSAPGQDVSNQLSWGRPTFPRGGACFFEHPNFNGKYFCLAPGESVNSTPRGFNDKISSIRVFGNATTTIYNDRNFGGIRLPIPRNIADLRNVRVANNPSKTWNDRTSSIAVRRR
jgi:hypothetical protein